MSPELRELITEIEVMVPDFAEVDLVLEVVVEQAHMVMGALRCFSVFSTCVVAEVPESLVSKAFHELLQVWLVEAPIVGKIGVIVRQRKEAIVVAEGGLVDHPHSPV